LQTVKLEKTAGKEALLLFEDSDRKNRQENKDESELRSNATTIRPTPGGKKQKN